MPSLLHQRNCINIADRPASGICRSNTICWISGLCLWCGLIGNANAEAGLVTKTVAGCDYFLIDAPSGFVVAEWYGGHDPQQGDEVVGAFNSYAFATFFYGPNKVDGRVYIEDYGLDEDDALEQLSEKCN